MTKKSQEILLMAQNSLTTEAESAVEVDLKVDTIRNSSS